MDIIKLRTLTLKSILWFGKHEGKSIQNLIQLRQTQYLRWVYFSYEGISFNEDVLQAIGVFKEGVYDYRINKPGKDMDMHHICTNRKVFSFINPNNSFNPENYNRLKTTIKKRNKATLMLGHSIDKEKFSKKSLAWKNQGH